MKCFSAVTITKSVRWTEQQQQGQHSEIYGKWYNDFLLDLLEWNISKNWKDRSELMEKTNMAK